MKVAFTRQLAPCALHPGFRYEVDLLVQHPVNVTVWCFAAGSGPDEPPQWVEQVAAAPQLERVLKRAGVRKSTLAVAFLDTPDYARAALADLLWPEGYARPVNVFGRNFVTSVNASSAMGVEAQSARATCAA